MVWKLCDVQANKVDDNFTLKHSSSDLMNTYTISYRSCTISIARNRSRGDGEVENLALPTPLLITPSIPCPWSWQTRGSQMTLCGGTLLAIWVE